MSQRIDFPIITNLGNLAPPVNANDATTKAYVDAAKLVIKANGVTLSTASVNVVQSNNLSVSYNGTTGDVYLNPYILWRNVGASPTNTDTGLTLAVGLGATDTSLTVAGNQTSAFRNGDVLAFASAVGSSVTVTNSYYNNTNTIVVLASALGTAVSVGESILKVISADSYFSGVSLSGALSATNTANVLAITSNAINAITTSDLTSSITNNNATLNLKTQGGFTAGTFNYASVAVNQKGVVTGISQNTPITALTVNTGTARTGSIKLLAGTNITITDDGAGNFTFASTGGGGGISAQATWATTSSATKDQYTSDGTNQTVVSSGITIVLGTPTTGALSGISVTVGGASITGTPTVTGSNPYTLSFTSSQVGDTIALAGGAVVVNFTQGGTAQIGYANMLNTVAPVALSASNTTVTGAWSAPSYPYFATNGYVTWTRNLLSGGTVSAQNIVISDSGTFQLASAVSAGASTVTVALSTLPHLHVGTSLSGTGLVAGTTVASISSNVVTLSQSTNASIQTSDILTYNNRTVITNSATATATTSLLSDFADTTITGTVTGQGTHGANNAVVTLNTFNLPTTPPIYLPMFVKITADNNDPVFSTADSFSTTDANNTGTTITSSLPSSASQYVWVAVPTTVTASRIKLSTGFGLVTFTPDATFLSVSIGTQTYNVYGATNLSVNTPVTFIIQ